MIGEIIEEVKKNLECPDCGSTLEIETREGKHPRVLITKYKCLWCSTFELEIISHKW